MSWHCSLALVEEFSRLGCLDGAQSARLSAIRTAEKFCYGAKKKVTSKRSPSGTTSAPSREGLGVEAWRSSLPASPASPSVSPASGKVRMTTATSGPRPSESFVKWDPDLRSWRTFQVSLLTNTLEPFSGSWPRAGTMSAGECCRRLNWELRISVIGSGLWGTPRNCSSMAATINPQRARHKFPNLETQVARSMWPTPQARADSRGEGGKASRPGRQENLHHAVKRWPTPQARDGDPRGAQAKRYLNPARSNDLPDAVKLLTTPCADDTGHRKSKYKQGGTALSTQAGGQLNPTWVAWLMGWPIGWTALEPLETVKFQQWLEQHGNS